MYESNPLSGGERLSASMAAVPREVGSRGPLSLSLISRELTCVVDRKEVATRSAREIERRLASAPIVLAKCSDRQVLRATMAKVLRGKRCHRLEIEEHHIAEWSFSAGASVFSSLLPNAHIGHGSDDYADSVGVQESPASEDSGVVGARSRPVQNSSSSDDAASTEGENEAAQSVNEGDEPDDGRWDVRPVSTDAGTPTGQKRGVQSLGGLHLELTVTDSAMESLGGASVLGAHGCDSPFDPPLLAGTPTELDDAYTSRDTVERPSATRLAGVPGSQLTDSALTIEDLACASFPAGEVVILVWVMKDEARSLLSFLDYTETEHVELERRLSARRMTIVILTHAGILPSNPEYGETKKQLQEIRRELDDLAKLEEPPEPKERLSRRFQDLMNRHFTGSAFHTFVSKFLGQTAREYLPEPAGQPSGTLINQLFMVLEQRNALEDEHFFEALERSIGGRNEELARLRIAFTNLYRSNDERRKGLEYEASLLEEKLQRHSAREPVHIDAIEVILANHVPDPADRQLFELARQEGRWGRDDDEVIRELRTSIERSELIADIQGTTTLPDGVSAPSLSRLARLRPLEQLVIFVASSLIELSPEDFRAVVEGLLKFEGERLDELMCDGQSEHRVWNRNGDLVLEHCGLEVRLRRRDQEDRLAVVWMVRAHGPTWARFLNQHRYYFVARQVDRLIDHCLLDGAQLISNEVFERALRLQSEQAKRAPEAYRARWVVRLSRLIRILAQITARSSPTNGEIDAESWQLVNQIHERLRISVREIARIEKLRSVVDTFFERLIADKHARAWTLSLLRKLEEISGIDRFSWLLQLFRAVPGCLRHALWNIAHASSSPKRDVRHEIWNAVGGWLPIDDKPSRDERRAALGIHAALVILRVSTDRLRESNGFHEEFRSWTAAKEGEPLPPPVHWLMNQGLLHACERSHAGEVEIAVKRVLMPPWPIEAEHRDSILLRCSQELSRRFPAQSGQQAEDYSPRRHSLFVACVLVLWELRNQSSKRISGDSRGVGARIASAIGERRIWLEISEVLAAFSEILSPMADFVAATPDREEERPLPSFYRDIAKANHVVRSSLDSYLMEKSSNG